eukprot:CAMPEP_0198520282 /NCGR_PEP_ID=MMETSP1462-20131121/20230_1 /TAXON_ID=1333877 /ORGANISM="Brandtodinium nutriculum, Strain RCC3387" /LENGTH=286 /DNA_ID=CAMNT_0044249907 /DNA_START=87 /DNA_END=947 /DNA_ORIENTATION=-
MALPAATLEPTFAGQEAKLAAIENWAVVRNTFLHFPADEEEELMLAKRSLTRSRSLPTTPTSFASSLSCTFFEDDDFASRLSSEATPPTTARGDSGDSSGSDDDRFPGRRCAGAACPAPLALGAARPVEIARGMTYERTHLGGARLLWTVEEKRISGQDKMFVSPSFHLALSNFGKLPFKLILHAAVPQAVQKKGKGSQGFKSAEGWVRVELKFCDDLQDRADIGVSIAVGLGDLAQPVRGPVRHNLAQQSMCGLPKGQDMWHLPRSVDPVTRRVHVVVMVEPSAA